ncbi:MAG: ATP-dependent DNA helicase RecG [Firmicutes bacterium]|nr:ATP-dependent DNA helicase RecG [Bacillota bacterium]
MTLKDIKGLGEKRIQNLNGQGIYTPADLLSITSSAYFDTSVISGADSVTGGENVLLKGELAKEPEVRFIRRGFNICRFKFRCAMSGRDFYAVYYNQPYRKAGFTVGETYLCFGKAKCDKTVSLLNPLIEAAAEPKSLRGILTVYPKVGDIPPTIIKEAAAQALKIADAKSVLPEEIIFEYSLLPLKQAYTSLHAPQSLAELPAALRSAAAEELVQLLIAFEIIKKFNSTGKKFSYADKSLVWERAQKLPYSLTESQKNVLSEVLSDMSSGGVMNRLIHGDVGAGKTVIAFLAMYYAAISGFQAALMAPTEILVRQHYQNFCKLFPEIPCVFLTGSQKKSVRDTALFNLKNGTADAVIGTHALLSEGVEFCNPALIVTDEQHRFGVSQRSALEDKAGRQDALHLSATPIPRSMSLIIYGDLDVSYLYGRAKSEFNVSTAFCPEIKLGDMYKYIAERAAAGVQTYIVCPRVENDEDGEEEELTSAKKLYKKLSAGVLASAGLGLLHGKMKESEKAAVMDKFVSGAIKILVTTTVIEVGVDVEAANIMVIFDAERFGLAQLHQLRGRVGRGAEKGFVFLVTSSKNKESLERLQILKNNTDGFELSEFDLAERGAGDFIGVRQHGAAGVLSHLRLDKDIISLSKEISSVLKDRYKYDYEYFIKSFLKRRYAEMVKDVTLN